MFNYRASRNELVARFGAPHIIDEDSKGVGLFDAWLLQFECGLEVAIWQYQSDVRGVRIASDDAPRIVELHANDCELFHLAFHVGVDARAIERWVPDPTYIGAATWRVMRQDDNGNEFLITSYTSRCQAEAVVAAFAARGHKQVYWVEFAAARVIRTESAGLRLRA